MSLFAITFRLLEDDGRRVRALEHAVRRLSPKTLIYDEAPGFYLMRADIAARQLRETLAAAADLQADQDLLLVINLSQPDYAQAGSEIPQRLDALMGAR